MSRDRVLGAWLLLSLAACGAEPSADGSGEPAGIANAGHARLPDADINASLGELGADPAPPQAATLGPARYVGRWSVDARSCADAAWRFTETELRTPAGSVCRFTEAREVPGGYDIAARCTAEGPERNDLLRLRFAESAQGLLFESDSIADAGLVPCDR